MPLSIAINVLPTKSHILVQEFETDEHGKEKAIHKNPIPVRGGETLQRNVQPGRRIEITEFVPKQPGAK